MAEITRERQGEIVQAVFKVLSEHPEGMQAKHVIAQVEQRVMPTQFELADYASTPGRRRFDKILRFNTIPAVKAGWLVKSRGIWTVTQEGLAALDVHKDPADFMRESVRLYRAWRTDQPAAEGDDDEPVPDVDEEEPEVVAKSSLEEASDSAWDGIRAFVGAMNAYAFQDLVAALLQGMGYHVSWVAPPGPDQGLDILAHHDPLGADGRRIKVQVKQRPESKANPSDIRSFMAILGSGDIGIYVSTGGFTSEAQREARNQEVRRVTLIDLDQLVQLWSDYYEKIDESRRRLLPLQPVWFLAPPE